MSREAGGAGQGAVHASADGSGYATTPEPLSRSRCKVAASGLPSPQRCSAAEQGASARCRIDLKRWNPDLRSTLSTRNNRPSIVRVKRRPALTGNLPEICPAFKVNSGI